MTKFEQNIEKSYKKDFQKAKQFFLNHEYKKAEKLFLKCYKYYKNKNQLKMAYEALEKYIIVLIRIGVNQRALPRLNELLDFSNRTDNKQYKALVYGLKGIIYKNMGDINKSIEYTKNAIELFRELENFNDLIKSYINIGNSYYFQGKYEDSLDNYKKAEIICIEKRIFNGLSGVFQFISFSYLALNNIEKFKEYREKVFEYIDYVNDPDKKIEILNNFSIPSFYTDDSSEFLYKLLLKLLDYCNEHNLNNQKVKTLRNLAGISTEQGKYIEAKNYLDQALSISETFDFEIDKAYIYNNLGILFYKDNKLDVVIRNLKKSISLSKKYNIIPLIIDGYKFLGNIYKKEKAYDKSYRHYREALDYFQKISGNISSIEQRIQFRMSYQHLPKIIEELNKLIDSRDITVEFEELISFQKISKEICSTANKRYNNVILEDCKRLINKLIITNDELMQEQLENDARKLFRKRDKYIVQNSGEEIKLSNDEIDLLFEKTCLRDKKSKTTEIDLFGEKIKVNSLKCYILGECTFKNKTKIYKKISCFFTKANILAEQLVIDCERSYQIKPQFNLVIISMQGFPKEDVIKKLENSYLKISPILRNVIEYIDIDSFIRLLKENNIKNAKYKKYRENIIPNRTTTGLIE